MIISKQIRAARALIGWEQRDLAEASGLSLPTVKRMEGSAGLVRGHYESVSKVVAALEKAGVDLIEENDLGGYGVRFRKAMGAAGSEDDQPTSTKVFSRS